MTKTTLPHGENLRNAIRWISEQRQWHAGNIKPRELVEKASLRFDLTPLEEDFLIRKFVGKSGG
jgi:hypothetical protein